MTIFAAIRCQKIKSMGQLRTTEAHGKRIDQNSQKRCDPDLKSETLAVSKYSPDQPLELVDAFKNLKQETGAKERNGSPLGLHLIAVISPEHIAKHGDPHNPNNPANQKLFEQAQVWAEKQFGVGSVMAARMDMDEKGAGVVDLFVVPLHEIKQRQGSRQKAAGEPQQSKMMISTNQALEAIQERYSASRSYEALQTSWAEHAKAHISPDIERGRPKVETQREHVHADIFRTEVEQIKPVVREMSDTLEISEAVLDGKLQYRNDRGNHTLNYNPWHEEPLSSERADYLKYEVFYQNERVRSFVATIDELKEKALDFAREKIVEMKKVIEPFRQPTRDNGRER